MAVLIETSWSMPGGDSSNARVVTAILPSGKILTRDDDEAPFGSDRSVLQSAIGEYKILGYSEDKIFNDISLEFSSTMWNRFSIINDPKEAREVIKEAELTATITPRERLDYRGYYDPSVGDGTQLSYAEIRLKKDLEQSNGDQE